MYESQHRINTPRTWQDINNSLDPTAASNWRLSSIKRYNLESRTSTPPPFQASRRLFIEWRWWQNYIARWFLTYGTYKKDIHAPLHAPSDRSAVSHSVAPLTDMHIPLHDPSDRSAVFHFVAPLIGAHAIYMFLLLTCAFSHSHETLTLPLLCPNGSCACTRHDTNPPWYKLKASCCKEGIPKGFCNDDNMVWIFLRCKTETRKFMCGRLPGKE
jgi:hypothetical protein